MEIRLMIKSLKSTVALLVVILGWSIQGTAQTVQYVTITGTYPGGNNLSVQPNQIVSVVGFDWTSAAGIVGISQNGTNINMGLYTGGGSGFGVGSQIPQIFIGLTNISVIANPVSATHGYPGAATFQITTPATTTVISNYVPADAIVIPASATGNVQVILESSPDLVNWTAASPGTYGASAGTNRFFRVRAAAN
jgi:hypothetical protein